MSTPKSAALYYADDISYANLGLHDYIIVESDNISPYTHGFKTYKKKLYAYVSVGEAASYRKYYKALKPEWKLSKNTTWNATILDISNDDYHQFVYDKIIQPLVDKGYENFFFDTLDSYQLLSISPEQTKEYEKGLIRLIKKFKQRFPKAKLIVNRGFEVLDEVHQEIDAVLFESMFHGLNARASAYKEVKEEDRKWLLDHVKKAQVYHLDVISVEYIDIRQKDKIEKTIERLEALGIIPYVTNKEFTRYGNSSKHLIKREVLVFYSQSVLKQHSNAHYLASLPLEYLGYIPVLKPIEEGLPSREELSRYKGVIIWNEKAFKQSETFEKWIETLVNEKIKVLFLDGFGIADDTHLCKFLEIKKEPNRTSFLQKTKIVHQDEIFGFETPLSLGYFQSVYVPKKAQRLLDIEYENTQRNVPVAITPWGGYALSGTTTSSFGENTLWVLNPFSFFKEALALETIPVPDPTTENGRRLLFTHIDGDASMNKAEWDPRSFSIGVMYEKILKKYTIPQGVSIVEAEMNPRGLYPKDSAALEAMAQKIYALPYVEAATHTYTHPFKWMQIKEGRLSPQYRLKVEDYNFSIDREINGSLSYINSRLLSKDKKPAKTVYWTGDCMPQEDVLEYTYKHDILNINGGDTIITNDKPWLSLVAPLGLKRGEYRQVYTGAENENVYTNDWLGPFWGFKKVIQTFELTNTPRRLKPIDIYYHFYAASKTASLTALDEVYQWALLEEVMPIYTSEYIPKVLEFYDMSMSKENNRWHFYGMKELKTLRVDKENLHLVYKSSQSIIGQKKEGKSTYVHLNTQASILELQEGKKADENYLIDTNAQVLGYINEGKQISFHLKGYVDIVLNYHLKKGCELHTKSNLISKEKKGSEIGLKFKTKEADVLIQCQ